MKPLPSLACSGAVLGDVVAGHPTGEAERRLSQIGRIDGDPDVVTITIGGNDLGFRKILVDCIERNCIAKYRRPADDVLDDRIDELAAKPPDAYRAVQAAAPRALVVVVDYAKLFPDAPMSTARRAT